MIDQITNQPPAEESTSQESPTKKINFEQFLDGSVDDVQPFENKNEDDSHLNSAML
jgi:hypothetical protein